MKKRSFIMFMPFMALILFGISCTETETEYVDRYIDPRDTLSPPNNMGIVNSMDGTWDFDKVHSNINWATEYQDEHADLTGRFNNFNVDINFDFDNYADTKIEAWVQLSTFNTGEPGRDGPGKCGPGYMGVEYTDTIYTVDATTDSAFFKSTGPAKIEYNMYVIPGELTFLGVTKAQSLSFRMTKIEDATDRNGNPIQRVGFEGEFNFNAVTDYGVTSTSIGDLVRVHVNANFNKG